MELIGTILDGRHQMSPEQQRLERRYLATMKDGTVVRKKWTKKILPKTHQQIKAHWGLAITMILQHFDDHGWDTSVLLGDSVPTGIAVSKGLLQEYLYVVCPIYDDEGIRITLSKTNIPQASKFFNDVCSHAATKWSCYIPDPDPNWRETQQTTNGV